MGTYQITVTDTNTYSMATIGTNLYSGGTLIQSNGVTAATDRLGSVRSNANGEKFAYYPYGVERTSTPDGREKFGTYFRDLTLNGVPQDYADQRYYNANVGAFWSPDPGGVKTAKPKNPITWNRYIYANDDPVNRVDPAGTDSCFLGESGGGCDLPPSCDPLLFGLLPTPGCDAGGDDDGSDDDATEAGPTPCSFSAQSLQNYMLNATAYKAHGVAIPTGMAGRPLAAFANQIMSDAVEDNIDPRLLVAIAFVEGKWGGDTPAARTQNSFGLHNRKGQLANFTNAGGWATGVQEAADVVAGMISNGLSTVSLLYGGQAGAYCQGSGCIAHKGSAVTKQLQALGGNAQSLTSPCYYDASSGNYYEKQ